MKPVWIKYYGVIPMTRTGYLIALAAAGGFAVVLFTFLAVAGLLPPLSTMWRHDPTIAEAVGPVGALFYNYCYWLVLVCLVAQAIDTYAVLRKFAQKEAEQRRRLAERAADQDPPGEPFPAPPQTHVRAADPRRPDEHVR